MSTDFQTKSIPGQLNVDQAEGIVECFVAGIGNKDSVGDIVLPGAFEGSLKRRKPRVVWGHDWNHPIGRVLEIYEVGPNDRRLPEKMRSARIGGLFAKVQFNLKSERGREAFANISFFGAEQEWSIGYKTIQAVYDNTRQANLLKEVELYEVSPVLHGANQLTGTISIKSDDAKDRVTSFKKSKWPMFDRAYAERIKTEHPDIWDKGGNIKGDDQYTILTRIAAQGGVAKTEDQIQALELREAWIARHLKDFQLPGVVAQMKWLAIGSRGEGHMKDVVREAISKSSDGKAEAACPIATRDVAVNLENRQKAIESAGYGPLNPEEPNLDFWAGKARRWDVSTEDAQKQKCGNCAAFVKTERMMDCIKQGLANESGNEAEGVIEAGDLGYCEAFDFKCAAARTCDAWIGGGPVTSESEEQEKGYGYGKPHSGENREELLEMWRRLSGYAADREGSSDDDPREELDEIAESAGMSNPAMGRQAVLARSLANELRSPVRIRTMTSNTVVFDVMDPSDPDDVTTMRSSWHAEEGRVMIGKPERVRVETVYVPMEGGNGEAYDGDERLKVDPRAGIPQEAITGDILRGYGPRRGNLERLLRYWRPIMKKPGGFRRCRVILADHPELYPLENICAWLHHETTGLWPNEGCHHPGMKNCKRKLRGVRDGSIWSDAEFGKRIRRRSGNKKDLDLDDYEDMGEITDEDVKYANRVLNEFLAEEKEFAAYLADEKNWEEIDDDNDSYKGSGWVKPDNWDRKPGGCGCGCAGKGGAGSCSPYKSVEDSLDELREKVGRSLNSRNAERIAEAIRLLTEVIGGGPEPSMERKQDGGLSIAVPIDSLYEMRETIDPIVDYYGLDVEVDEDGVHVKGELAQSVVDALSNAVNAFEEIQTKGFEEV